MAQGTAHYYSPVGRLQMIDMQKLQSKLEIT